MTESNVKFFKAWALCLSAVLHAGGFFFLTNKQPESGRRQSDSISLMRLQLLPVLQSSASPQVASSEYADLAVPADQATLEKNEGQRKALLTEEAMANPATHYYSALELSERAQVIEDLPKDFSLSVRDGDPLSAIVLIMIDEYGEVENVEIGTLDTSESKFSEETQLALKAALGKMRFLPGKIEGKAVRSRLHLEILLENMSPSINSEQTPF